MKLILLRHATVIEAYKKCYNGWVDPDIQPFKKNLDIHFDQVISSDLKRCTQTLNALNITDYSTDMRLREVRFKGHIEGKTFEQIGPPASALTTMKHWYEYLCDESQFDYRNRIESFLDDLNHDNILLCTHRGTIGMIQSIVSGRDYFEILKTPIDNLAIIELQL